MCAVCFELGFRDASSGEIRNSNPSMCRHLMILPVEFQEFHELTYGFHCGTAVIPDVDFSASNHAHILRRDGMLCIERVTSHHNVAAHYRNSIILP